MMNYEDKIRKRRCENRQLLKKLGIFNLHNEHQCHKSSDTESSPKKYLKKVSKLSKPTFKASDLIPTRKSSRLLGKAPPKFFEAIDFDHDDEFSPKVTPKYQLPKQKIKRENVFGAITDVPVGTIFCTRMEASHAGIHRPPVSGIHGNPAVGCYSLALSGGYEDDVDLGDSFIYTGEGGRDLRGTKSNPKNLRTAPQSKDQILERGNLALSKNVENDLPVRVLRGFKLRSKFAPEEGYRYDGLYKVVEYYMTTGLSGFKVYKFRMERVKDQEPAPWDKNFLMKEELDYEQCFSVKENVPKEDQLHSELNEISDTEFYCLKENLPNKEDHAYNEKEENSNVVIPSPEEKNAVSLTEKEKTSSGKENIFSPEKENVLSPKKENFTKEEVQLKIESKGNLENIAYSPEDENVSVEEKQSQLYELHRYF